jgi:hypothetical protein
MNILWSDLEQAQRDLLLHSAQDDSFRRLADWYGFVYQYGFAEGSWRRALQELAFGRRGSKMTTFNVVRHVLRQYDEVVKVLIDSSNPNELIFMEGISEPSRTAFDHKYVNRYISTPWGIMRSVGPTMCSGSTLQLADTSSLYWKAPSEIVPETSYDETFEARFLPFEYYEWQPAPVFREATVPDAPPTVAGYHPGEPCLVDVYILGHIIPNVPTTYLQPDGELTGVGVPLGGQLLDDEFVQGFPRTTGPHPLYLMVPDVFDSVRAQIQASLAAGVELRLRRALSLACPSP